MQQNKILSRSANRYVYIHICIYINIYMYMYSYIYMYIYTIGVLKQKLFKI
jgi:hypothetical protein